MGIIAFVQAVGGQAGTPPGTSLTTSTFTAIGAGHSIVGFVNSGASGNLSSITDNASGVTNTYTILDNTTQFASFGVWNCTFVGINIRGGPTTLTFHYTASDAGGAFCFIEETNVLKVNTGSFSDNGNVTVANPSLTVTTTVPNCRIISILNPSGATVPTAGSGYVIEANNTGSQSFYIEDRDQLAAGSIAAGWTDADTAAYFIAALAFEPIVPLPIKKKKPKRFLSRLRKRRKGAASLTNPPPFTWPIRKLHRKPRPAPRGPRRIKRFATSWMNPQPFTWLPRPKRRKPRPAPRGPRRIRKLIGAVLALAPAVSFFPKSRRRRLALPHRPRRLRTRATIALTLPQVQPVPLPKPRHRHLPLSQRPRRQRPKAFTTLVPPQVQPVPVPRPRRRHLPLTHRPRVVKQIRRDAAYIGWATFLNPPNKAWNWHTQAALLNLTLGTVSKAWNWAANTISGLPFTLGVVSKGWNWVGQSAILISTNIKIIRWNVIRPVIWGIFRGEEERPRKGPGL